MNIQQEELATRSAESWRQVSTKRWDPTHPSYSEDSVLELVDSGLPPALGWKAIVARGLEPLTDAMPNVKTDTALTLVHGHRAVTIAHLTGSHSADLRAGRTTTRATGRDVSHHVASAIEFADDGTVQIQRVYADLGETAAQLGLSDALTRPAARKPHSDNEIWIARHTAEERANLHASQQLLKSFNAHDLSSLVPHFAPDVVWSQSGSDDDWDHGHAVTSHERYFAQFSDLVRIPTAHWAAGPYVVQEGILRGTFDGELEDSIPKTGKTAQIRYLQVARFAAGRIVRLFEYWNSLELARQLEVSHGPNRRQGNGLCCIFCVSCCIKEPKR